MPESEYLVIGEHVPAKLDVTHKAPSSYLDVLRSFGLGEFVDTFRILPPDELVSYGHLLSGFGLELPTELASIIVCAAGSEGSRFGWRPSDDTDESGERPVLWVPNGCLDLDDCLPQVVATTVTQLVKMWALPRWAGPGIQQPYFVTRQPRGTREMPALSPGRSHQLAHDRLAAAFIARAGARILYQQADANGASLCCYVPGVAARVYVGTTSPEHTAAAFDSHVRIVAPFGALEDAGSTIVALLDSLDWALDGS